MTLSKESQEFLDHLRLYLISKGKKFEEINEITTELEDHLREAEQNGKSVDDIIGHSPEEYMEQLSDEMKVDYKGWMKAIPIIVIGAFAYVLLGDAIRGTVSYSLLGLVGYPIVTLGALGIFSLVLKYIAKNNLPKWKEILLFSLNSFLTISLYVALLFWDKKFGEPFFELNTTGHIIVGLIAVLIFVAIAIWSRAWFPIIVPALLFTPQVVVEWFPLSKEYKMTIAMAIAIISLLIYSWIESRKED